MSGMTFTADLRELRILKKCASTTACASGGTGARAGALCTHTARGCHVDPCPRATEIAETWQSGIGRETIAADSSFIQRSVVSTVPHSLLSGGQSRP